MGMQPAHAAHLFAGAKVWKIGAAFLAAFVLVVVSWMLVKPAETITANGAAGEPTAQESGVGQSEEAGGELDGAVGGVVEDKTAKAADVSGDAITVTFAITNAAYTSDPASGETHLTSTADLTSSSSGLTFTSWAGRYKITGTGTLATFSIPAGSTLADAGFALPKVTVENIGTANQNSYLSSYNWSTSDGMICNADTVLNADTELSLTLFQDGENYSLNFVCGDEDNHSVTYVLGGYPSATFALGQSVSDPYIPTADDIDENYVSQWCQHGKNAGETFAGWYLKDASGNEVPFAAGTKLTNEYLNPDADRTVNVYAKWQSEEAPVVEHAVTFVYGDTVIDSRQVADGEALGALPDMSEYETDMLRFLHWADASGNAVSAADAVTGDMVITAVFKDLSNVTYHSVVLHEVDPDGNESGVTIDLSVEDGMTLSDAMKEGAATLSDGTAAADCVWHSGADSDPVFALSQAVTSDLELYTYSYRITLKLQEETGLFSLFRLVSVSDDGTTITIVLNEGETLKASDLVINGVDYSVYKWEDADGEPVDITSLRGACNLELTTDKTFVADVITGTVSFQINFYVYINGEDPVAAREPNPVQMTAYRINDGSSKGWSYYLSAAQLESIYGKYGFIASDLKASSRLFPHTDDGSTLIYADRAAFTVDGMGFSPILNKESYSTCDVYYLPNETCMDNGSVDAYKSTDSFYTVTVSDEHNIIYEEGESLPDTQYVLSDGEATVKLKGEPSVWRITGSSAVPTSNGDGTCTLKLTNVTSAVSIEPAIYTIIYDAPSDDSERQNAGNYYGLGSQQWVAETLPTIGGEKPKVVYVAPGDTHTILEPDSHYAQTKVSIGAGDYLATYVFQRWKVNGATSNTVEPSAVLDAEWLQTNADGNYAITLTPDWEINPDGGERTNTCSFWIIVDSSKADSTDDNIGDKGNYSDALYSTSVINGNDVDLLESGGQHNVLIHGSVEGIGSAVNADSLIRELDTDGYKGVRVAEFPTDEEVLARLRSWGDRNSGHPNITIDGSTIPLSELTTENYTIRWYVFKYDASDGWHIDGKLVPKVGKLTVTKTFYGDSSAIDAVEEGFSISAEPMSDSTTGTSSGSPTYSLSLGSSDEVSDDENTPQVELGYTEVVNDSGTNTTTYTWVLDVQQQTEYKLTENNYQYSSVDGSKATIAEYLISNSDAQSAGKWQTYNSQDGVVVTAKSYAEDIEHTNYQTVSFMNSYLDTGSMLVRKVDSATGTSIGNVSFVVKNSSGGIVPVWSLNGTNKYYLFNPTNTGGIDAGSVTEHSDGVVTGDAKGNFEFVGLKDAKGAGEFWLYEEAAPAGYSLLTEPVKLTVGANGSVALESNDNAELVSAENGAYELRITNDSKTSKVVVQKSWLDSTNLPVTFQLYRNGASMGSEYAVTLYSEGAVNADGKSMGETPWTCEFDGLPLYVGDSPAVYTVRETWIGSQGSGGTAYDPSADETDGYADYTVVVGKTSYMYDSDGSVSTDLPYRVNDDGEIEYASTAKIVVSNKVDNGDVTFMKVDESGSPVPGAKFTIYSDSNCTQVVAEATSNESGIVTFTNLIPGTYYMMRETGTPAGYLNDGKTYTVVVSGNSQLIYDSSDESKTSITEIVNKHGVELPESGGSGIGAFALGGLAVIAVAAIVGFALRRRIFGRCHA